MRPAFSSTRQAVLFALFVAIPLALPAVIARTKLLDRRDVYPAIPLKWGYFPFVQQKIFEEKYDVDIAILGSSRIWTAVYTPHLKDALSKKLGRPAEVFSLGWPWPGFDADYVIARDLLAQRRVHVLVIGDEDLGPDDPHVHAGRWFRIGENSEALDGLSLYAQSRLYGTAVLGMPRQLLSMARPNLVEDPVHAGPNFWTSYYRAPSPASQDGALRARLAMGGIYAPFNEFKPTASTATPDSAAVYSDATRDAFDFPARGDGMTAKPYQRHFLRKLAQLCQEHGTKLVMLNTPALHERESSVIIEPKRWGEIVAGASIAVLGIPPTKLYAGIAPDDVPKLFYEDAHLNENGQDLFTPLITPRLLELYEQSLQQRP